MGQNFKPGGKVGGKARKSGDSLKNDTVPAMLSPGEVVIPRLDRDTARRRRQGRPVPCRSALKEEEKVMAGLDLSKFKRIRVQRPTMCSAVPKATRSTS